MTMPSEARTDRRWRASLGTLLAAAAVVRVAYVVWQPEVDPTFARPILDGEVYVARALAWLHGEGGPEGAFYHAPGYPFLLTVLFGLFGGSFTAVYLVQHLAVVGSAWLAARVAREAAGDLAGLAAAALVVGYQPLLFFASRPLGEAFGMLLLLAAIAVVGDGGRSGRGAFGGALLGAAALVRPSALLILPLWVAWFALRGRRRTAAVLLATGLLTIIPVAVRNGLASGALVPVSSNAGLTLYHGNGPGAEGVYTPVEGMGGRVADQRDESTKLASIRSGTPLDPIAADRWWSRQAVRARADDPGGTFVLVLRKLALTSSSRELGLDDAPALDRNPWRVLAPVPFALMLGLLAAYPCVARRPLSGSLAPTWLALLAMLATPLVFYVSSRYRLPFAVLACIPAGIVIGRIAVSYRSGSTRRAGVALAVAAVATVASAAVPWGADLDRDMRATSHANRASAWMDLGRDEDARVDLDRARELDPDNALAWYNLGVLFDRQGRARDAETAYRRVPTTDPIAADAAGNLGMILVRRGRAREAIEVLEHGVRLRSSSRPCWTNLVVAYLSIGQRAEAVDAIARAGRAGVSLDPGLVAAAASGTEEGSEE